MIFCACAYRNELIFRPQSQCDAEVPSVFVFQAAVHKQTNAVQHLSPSSYTAPNFLVSESFPWLPGVLKCLVESFPMILPILLACDTSLTATAMPGYDVKIAILGALQPLTSRYVLSLIAVSP